MVWKAKEKKEEDTQDSENKEPNIPPRKAETETVALKQHTTGQHSVEVADKVHHYDHEENDDSYYEEEDSEELLRKAANASKEQEFEKVPSKHISPQKKATPAKA